MIELILKFFNLDLIKNSFIFGLTSAILAIFISPLIFLKIQKQSTNLEYKTIISNTLKKYTIFHFFIGSIPYSIMQFVSSASFGISDIINKKLILTYNLEFNILSILIGSIISGFLETILTLFFELKTIEANKKNLIYKKSPIKIIFSLILLRNLLYWVGPLTAMFIINLLNKKYGIDFSYLTSLLISFITGLLWISITIPIDVVISRKVGELEDSGFFNDIIINFKENGIIGVFSGSLMRIVTMTLFTICTVLTENFIYR